MWNRINLQEGVRRVFLVLAIGSLPLFAWNGLDDASAKNDAIFRQIGLAEQCKEQLSAKKKDLDRLNAQSAIGINEYQTIYRNLSIQSAKEEPLSCRGLIYVDSVDIDNYIAKRKESISIFPEVTISLVAWLVSCIGVLLAYKVFKYMGEGFVAERDPR